MGNGVRSGNILSIRGRRTAGEVDEDKPHALEERRSVRYRRQTSAERARDKEEEGEPETDSEGIPKRKGDSTEEAEDVLVDQLMKGDWNAVGRMAEQVGADQELLGELTEGMQEIQEKPEEGSSNEELMQDRESIDSAKRQLRVLDARTYTRNKLRKAGVALQLYKTRCELREKNKKERKE